MSQKYRLTKEEVKAFVNMAGEGYGGKLMGAINYHIRESYAQALKDVGKDLSALLRDANDLRDLERKLVEYNETLK